MVFTDDGLLLTNAHAVGDAGSGTPLPEPVVGRVGRRRALRVVEVVPGSPADLLGPKAGDLVLSVGRQPVSDAQGIRRLLFTAAIGIGLPVTVLRNGAMVDVIAVPVELSDG